MIWYKIIIGITLSVFVLGTYVIWFDKKNIFNHSVIGLCFVAYIIPLCILDLEYFASVETIRLYVIINSIGAIFYIGGLLIGYRWKRLILVDTVMKFSLFKTDIYKDSFWVRCLKTARFIYIPSVVIMALCFFYMGYLPMFAADPYSAKQFKGIYHPRYQQVALFYRTAKQFIQLLLPFFLISFYNRKKLSTFILIVSGTLLILVSLSRSETVQAFFLLFSIIIALQPRKWVFGVYIVSMVLIFSIGSSFWVIASYFFSNSGFNSLVDDQTISGAIASGAPDIADQLSFFEAFISNHVDFTYGLTFLGGLIPFNFKWNTAVWTLSVLNQTNDISEVASGGLRLPVSMWGYLSFGWAGAAFVPFFSAFFIGYITKKIRRVIDCLKPGYKSYMIFYFVAFLYINIGVVFSDYYRISIYFFPAFIFLALLSYFNKNKKKTTVSNDIIKAD